MSTNPTDTHRKTETNGSFGFLRQLLREPRAVGQCDLCGRDLIPDHEHLLSLPNRILHCSCHVCALLAPQSQDTRYRRIPHDVRFLPEFKMSEAQWDRFQIPINLAFFFHDSATGKVSAGYPSPAGLIESVAGQEAWESIVVDHPELAAMEPDVEAFLVNRRGTEPEYFVLPVDHCYRLIGLMRRSWQGLSGGMDVQTMIEAFLSRLKGQVHA